MIDGDVVRHEVELTRAPDVVFDHFTDAALLVRWIGLSADLQPMPGGRFRFEVAPAQWCEGSYVELDRPRRLVLTWGWREESLGVPPGSSRVEITLTPTENGGTLLRLEHHLPGHDVAVLHDDGWTTFLCRLRAAVAGETVGPHPQGDPAHRLKELRAD